MAGPVKGPFSVDDLEEVEARPGIYRRVLTAGNIQLVWYRYVVGSVFEPHEHPEEQLTLGIRGSLDFKIDGREVPIGPGSMVHIAGGINHSAINRGEEEALTLNIYTPPRKVG